MKKLLLIGMMLLCAMNVFAREVTVSITAGENWKGKHTPQFAIWLEDTEGNYITTLYVTDKASRKSWIFCPKVKELCSKRLQTARKTSRLFMMSMPK